MTKYFLETKKTQPRFNFMVRINGKFKYWLYNEFDDALNKAKSLNIDDKERIVFIDEPDFMSATREWRIRTTFKVMHHKVYYDPYGMDYGLHLKFYMDAGEWMNPEELNLEE